MDWLKKILNDYGLIGGSVLSLMTFIGNLAIYLTDGKLDGSEIHKLMASANGLELGIVILVMVLLKVKS